MAAPVLTERQIKAFAAIYVSLILMGSRTIDEVPAVLLDQVKKDLGITSEPATEQPQA